jgi:hypothetical protein
MTACAAIQARGSAYACLAGLGVGLLGLDDAVTDGLGGGQGTEAARVLRISSTSRPVTSASR